MGLQFSCPECFSTITANSQHAGKRVKCPTCGSAVQAPSGSGSRQAAPAAAGVRGGGKKKKKSTSGGSNGLIVGLAVGGGIATLIAVGVVAFLLGRSGTPEVPPGAPNLVVATTSTPESTAASPPQTVPDATQAVSLKPDMLDAGPGPASTASPDGTGETANTEPTSTAEVPADTAATSQPPSELSLTDLIPQVERSVVRILVKGQYGGSTGSGFVVDKEGTIVTNYHVIEGANSAEAEFVTGERTRVVGFLKLDDARDLAVIKVDFPAEKLHPIALASIVPQKGVRVAAFGAPVNLAFTATDGIVSAVRDAKELQHKQGTFVQTTAPISPGNSGGPLVNMRGEVVGVNSFKRADGENLNFAICSLDVQEVLNERGQTVTAISPESVPVKVSTSGFGGVESLVGTERGRLLLSQIREAIVIVAPFTYDPTGRISDYLKTSAENTILKRVGWTEIKRRSDLTGSTAIVTVLTYFQVGDQTTDDNLVSELVIRIQVVARDVSKEGVETVAIVLDEKDEVATASVRTLVEGRVSRQMESGVRSFFNKFVGDYRRAVKEADAAP